MPGVASKTSVHSDCRETLHRAAVRHEITAFCGLEREYLCKVRKYLAAHYQSKHHAGGEQIQI